MMAASSTMDRESRCVNYAISVLLGEDRAYAEAVAYGDPKDPSLQSARVCISSSGFFGEEYGTAASLPRLPLQEIEGVPLLFGSPGLERQGDRLVVHADIIASTFFLITRYEEVVRTDVRDEHGRFPGRESLPYRAGFIDRPVVEEYAALLRNWLRAVGVGVPEPHRQFSVLPTHDVDWVRRYAHCVAPLRTAASALLGRQPLRNIPEAMAVTLGLRKDPFDTFDELVDLDGSLGDGSGRSVYFFMADRRSAVNGAYDVRSRVTRHTIARLVEAGATIGLHTSRQASMRPKLIAKEKSLLERVCGFRIRRNRHHNLAWRETEDGWALVEAGIDWDSTLGYADVAGFRLGVCHPIPMFDPVRLEPFGIEEHPLIVMDCTLSNSNYMDLDEEGAVEHCERLLEQTRKHNGEFVLLWHNTVLARGPGNYHPRLYPRLVSLAGGASPAMV